MVVRAVLLLSLLHGGVPAIAGAIRVGIFDDTAAKPPATGQGDARAQLWAKGLGSKPLMSGRQPAGPYDIPATPGSPVSLSVYPDGRKGAEICVKLLLTTEMCPSGCARDLVSVAIEDAEVKIYGRPVRAATGEFEQVFVRSSGKAK